MPEKKKNHPFTDGNHHQAATPCKCGTGVGGVIAHKANCKHRPKAPAE